MGNIFDRLFESKSLKAENAFKDQKVFFANTPNPIIFDIGAFIGEVTTRLSPRLGRGELKKLCCSI